LCAGKERLEGCPSSESAFDLDFRVVTSNFPQNWLHQKFKELQENSVQDLEIK